MVGLVDCNDHRLSLLKNSKDECLGSLGVGALLSERCR